MMTLKRMSSDQKAHLVSGPFGLLTREASKSGDKFLFFTAVVCTSKLAQLVVDSFSGQVAILLERRGTRRATPVFYISPVSSLENTLTRPACFQHLPEFSV